MNTPRIGSGVLGVLVAIAAGIITPIVINAGCQPSFKEFESADGGFSVRMPGQPTEETRTINHPTIGPIEGHFFSSETDYGAYLVGYFDYPNQFVRALGSDVILDSGRDGVVANSQGELLSEQIISLNEHPGRAVDIKPGTVPTAVRMRTRFFLVANRLYEVIWVGEAENAFREQVGQFLDSFRLLETPTAATIPTAVFTPNPSTVVPSVGIERFVDPAGVFSLVIPRGWVADLEFGRTLFQEVAGVPYLVKFFGGLPITGGYQPIMMALGEPVPSGTNLDDLVEETVKYNTSEPGAIGTERVERKTVPIAGVSAELVIYMDSPEPDFPQGFETYAIYLLRRNVSWTIQCGGRRELDEEMAACKEALNTFRFEN